MNQATVVKPQLELLVRFFVGTVVSAAILFGQVHFCGLPDTESLVDNDDVLVAVCLGTKRASGKKDDDDE
jgi:hypothetical protein